MVLKPQTNERKKKKKVPRKQEVSEMGPDDELFRLVQVFLLSTHFLKIYFPIQTFLKVNGVSVLAHTFLVVAISTSPALNFIIFGTSK